MHRLFRGFWMLSKKIKSVKKKKKKCCVLYNVIISVGGRVPIQLDFIDFIENQKSFKALFSPLVLENT